MFINRVKTLDSKYNDSKTFVSFDETFTAQSSHMSLQDKTKMLQQSVQQKIREKKGRKCAHLLAKHQAKKYKKFLLLKKYTEDYEPEGNEFVALQQSLNKFKHIREKHTTIAAKEGESLHDIIADIKEEYLSDLNPDDIPNSEVSDVSDTEIEN